jgi:hypothetical protein
VDFYEGPVFGGKLERLWGPAEFRGATRRAKSAGSLIVGPGAVLVVLKNPRNVSLDPKRIVPDLAKAQLAGALEEFKILSAGSTAGD